MEDGKNPGLGIRDLHKQGYTGKGVTVAIIDQPILLDHPEYDGKIAEYFDSGCGDTSPSSMHGPSVASLLVGESIGAAPGAKVYYAAAPSWKEDAKYYADSLKWIIEENKKLPEGEKIRVVSVSAAPVTSNSFANGEQWDEAVKLAQQEGILVIDCNSSNQDTAFISSAYYDIKNPEDVTKVKAGFPNIAGSSFRNVVHVPTSFRTTAQVYSDGAFDYCYFGVGGLSWGIPYAAGVLALGWEIRPELDYTVMTKLLFDSAYIGDDKVPIINPPEFIKLVEAYDK